MQTDRSSSPHPNVVLILCDQWNPFCAGYMGHPQVRTPHLDKLAAEGIVFENAYCASPVCSPARASWLSGLYPHAHGVQVNCGSKPLPFRNELRRDTPTLGDLFKSAGYRCGIVGPWHLGRDWEPQHGFEDYWETYKYQRFEGEGRPDRLKEFYNKAGVSDPYSRKKEKTHGNDLDHMICSVLDDPRQQRTTWTVDRGNAFIEQRSGETSPFFLFLSVKDPHPPIVVPHELLELYPADNIPLPDTWDDPLEGKPTYQKKSSRWLGRSGPAEAYRRLVSHYYALLTHVDREIGRLLETLDREGIRDNTLIAFISDHGEMLGNHGLIAKRFFYEDAVRVPAVLSWPKGLPGGRRIRAPLAGVDLAPTLLELAGLQPRTPMDGRSLASVLRDGTEPAARPVFAELASEQAFDNATDDPAHLGAHIMVRHGEWKYVWNRFDTDELYSLREDPHECVNRVADPAAQKVVTESRRLIREMLPHTGPGAFAWCLEKQ